MFFIYRDIDIDIDYRSLHDYYKYHFEVYWGYLTLIPLDDILSPCPSLSPDYILGKELQDETLLRPSEAVQEDLHT